MPKKKQEGHKQQLRMQDRVPNLHYRSLTTEQLRAQPRFTALPPPKKTAAQLRLLSCERYVRQDSSTWSELHAGVLTTSRFKWALGCNEPAAAAKLGIHRAQRGGHHLQAAFHHLVASSSSLAAAGSTSSGAATAAATAASAAVLEFDRQHYNTQQAAPTTTAAAGSAQQQQDAARATSARVAAGGDTALKLTWGSVQEAAALYCLLQLFPAARLEEVGMFVVPVAQLPPSWGDLRLPGQLPALGASPDGVLVHKLTLLPKDFAAAAALLQRRQQQPQQHNAVRPVVPAVGAAAEAAALEQAEAAAVQLLLQRGFDRLACAASRPRRGVQLADSSSDSGSGSDEEHDADDRDAAASSSNSSSSSSSMGDGGSCGCSEPAPVPGSNNRATEASTAASPAASPAASAAAAAPLQLQAAGSLAFEPVSTTVLRALRAWQRQQQQQQGSASDHGRGDEAVTLVVREAVEVKNHCPFGARHKRGGKKGALRAVSFSFSPRGCAARVHPQWVPQLQLHLLATGCQSVLLASRCAERGLRVWRLWRDDAYLRDALQLLSQLQVQHVARNAAPPPNFFGRQPGHAAFLRRTLSIARGAECIADAGEEAVSCVPPTAINQAKFW